MYVLGHVIMQFSFFTKENVTSSVEKGVNLRLARRENTFYFLISVVLDKLGKR